jgi:hypothetical protein
MRLLAMRVMALLGLALVAASVGVDQPAALAAVVSVASIAALVVAASVVLAVAPRVVTVGARARQHREGLVEVPAPRHPATPGRTRSRAPGGELSAA